MPPVPGQGWAARARPPVNPRTGGCRARTSLSHCGEEGHCVSNGRVRARTTLSHPSRAFLGRVLGCSVSPRRGGGGAVVERPHPFEVVEAAHFGAEDVDDDVIGVDQHPIGHRQPFDAHVAAKLLLDPLGELLGHRRDLAGRAAAGDHHIVGDVRFAVERDGDDVERLVVVEGTKHEAVQRLGLFVGSAVMRSGCGYGQTASFRTGAGASRGRGQPGGETIP